MVRSPSVFCPHLLLSGGDTCCHILELPSCVVHPSEEDPIASVNRSTDRPTHSVDSHI